MTSDGFETNVLRAKIIQHISEEEAIAEIITPDRPVGPRHVTLHLRNSAASTEMRQVGQNGQYRFSFAPGIPMISLPAIGKVVMIDRTDPTRSLWSIDRTPTNKANGDRPQTERTPTHHHNGVPVYRRPSVAATTHNGVVCKQ